VPWAVRDRGSGQAQRLIDGCQPALGKARRVGEPLEQARGRLRNPGSLVDHGSGNQNPGPHVVFEAWFEQIGEAVFQAPQHRLGHVGKPLIAEGVGGLEQGCVLG
jgi:hypothetical protein